MGNYLNPGNADFRSSVSEKVDSLPLYVDKTGMIPLVNSLIGSKSQKYLCVSRSRRFGKTYAAEMLAAYYSRGCDSRSLFENLEVAKDPSWQTHLNAYDVIRFNVAEFYRMENGDVGKMIDDIHVRIGNEARKQYLEVDFAEPAFLNAICKDIYRHTGNPIVFVVDEYDHVFRSTDKSQDQRRYVEFLNLLFRDQEYVGLCYMTGILPVKKYAGQSSLGFFKEYSMISPKIFAPFTGFTEKEVRLLCERFGTDFEQMKSNYDGYQLGEVKSVYCPLSVSRAIREKKYSDYWGQTDTFMTLSDMIETNFDGLKDDIVLLLAGEHLAISTETYQNDLSTFSSKDDVLTALAHIGYLGFSETGDEIGEVFIPNWEVAKQYRKALKSAGMPKLQQVFKQSGALLDATIRMDEESVAAYLDQVHMAETSVLAYNDENSLACVIDVAFIAARQYYMLYREPASGKGFADVLFLPLPSFQLKPALIVELKWDKTAKGAISQIQERQYFARLQDYKGMVLLVGINCNKKTKKHECTIEAWVK